MARQNFNAVMAEQFRHEGGYVDHPADPGGATNMGITLRTLESFRGQAVSKTQVKNLTREEAREIYRQRYWSVIQGDELPAGFDLVAMDGAVNSGPKRGIKWLQLGLQVRADGVMGPNTIAASRRAKPAAISRACAARMSFLMGLRHWNTFKRGWSRRVAEVEAVAIRMWSLGAQGKSATTTMLGELSAKADRSAAIHRNVGVAKTTTATGGGAAATSTPDLSPEVTAAIIVGAVAVGLLLLAQSIRKARYQDDRRDALKAEMEALL